MQRKLVIAYFKRHNYRVRSAYLRQSYVNRVRLSSLHLSKRMFPKMYLRKTLQKFDLNQKSLPNIIKILRDQKRTPVLKRRKRLRLLRKRKHLFKRVDWFKRTTIKAFKRTSRYKYKMRKVGRLLWRKKRFKRRYVRRRLPLSTISTWRRSDLNLSRLSRNPQGFIFRQVKLLKPFQTIQNLNLTYPGNQQFTIHSWFSLLQSVITTTSLLYTTYYSHYKLNPSFYFLINNQSSSLKRHFFTRNPLSLWKLNLSDLKLINNFTKPATGRLNLINNLILDFSTNYKTLKSRCKRKRAFRKRVNLSLVKFCFRNNRIRRFKRLPRTYRKNLLTKLITVYRYKSYRRSFKNKLKVRRKLKLHKSISGLYLNNFSTPTPFLKLTSSYKTKKKKILNLLPFYKLRKLWRQPTYTAYSSTLLEFLQIRILYIRRNQPSLPSKYSPMFSKLQALNTYPSLRNLLTNSKSFENSVYVPTPSSSNSKHYSLTFTNWVSNRVRLLLNFDSSATFTASLPLLQYKRLPFTKNYKYKRRYFRKTRKNTRLEKFLKFTNSYTSPTSFSLASTTLKVKPLPQLSSFQQNPSLLLLYFTTFNQLSIKWWLSKNLNNSTNFKNPIKLVTSLSNLWNSSQFNERYNFIHSSNLTPSMASRFFIKKRLYKVTTVNKFSLPVIIWYYQTLIKFMESVGGLKVRLQFNPFITHSLSFTDLARARLWASRVGSFQRLLGHRIFINESIQILQLAVRTKDPTFLANWIKGMLGRMGFWKYRVFFRFIKYIFRYLFWPVFSEFNFKGLKLRLKGKVSVAGNARTRAIAYKIGETSNATYDNKVLHDYSIINTFTGVLGFQIWMYF